MTTIAQNSYQRASFDDLFGPDDAPDATASHKVHSKRQGDCCDRCRRPAPMRGRFTATIAGVRNFICAACCDELVRDVENYERRNYRADRRAA